MMPRVTTLQYHPPTPSSNCALCLSSLPENPRSEFTLLVAGCRGGKFWCQVDTLNILTPGTGKTSFLRLLLDTSTISPATTKDQLASVAKFVQGCSSHTSYIRAASVEIELDTEVVGGPRQIGLTIVDTPSLDFKDEAATERLLSETLRHIDSRLAEGVENVSARLYRGVAYIF
jgi:hypothetical protein